MELSERWSMYRSIIHVATSIVSKPTESGYNRAQSGEVLSHSFSVVIIGTKKAAIKTAQMTKNKPDFQMTVNDEWNQVFCIELPAYVRTHVRIASIGCVLLHNVLQARGEYYFLQFLDDFIPHVF